LSTARIDPVGPPQRDPKCSLTALGAPTITNRGEACAILRAQEVFTNRDAEVRAGTTVSLFA